MRQLPKQEKDPNLLVGTETSDDGGVYKLTDELALIQTIDYFTPIVDDPYMFGQIAAANALSDVYAMGGVPKTVLNIVGYPMSVLGPDVLAEILKGAAEKVKEAGAVTVGGHSIDDQEPKFGLAVTGLVHPDRYYKNVGAKPGDVLILTKPIGVGIQTTAIKQDKLSGQQIETVSAVMAQLNKKAAEALTGLHPHAVTDVTGFGLLGHAYEMASGSDVSFVIQSSQVPVLEGTESLAKAGIIPGGTKKNLRWLEQNITFNNIPEHIQFILADAITSGGLLISLPNEEAKQYLANLHNNGAYEAAIIGEVVSKANKAIAVT
ncbi:selenophosphate synthase [Scopulibacillus darangshiensis]|uniref:Selenide, water dikinase n=1 Tax=Scopulibacillus darangshiensis TaxID=442528 RepID=A0A4R2P5U7_9BACL|nr:selenophosphate synthase [Scopulibacillus darangshiensis]